MKKLSATRKNLVLNMLAEGRHPLHSIDFPCDDFGEEAARDFAQWLMRVCADTRNKKNECK